MTPRYFKPLKLIEKKQSFFLFGARGTGKTSLIREAFKHLSAKMELDFLEVSCYRRYLENPSLLRYEVDQFLKNRSDIVVALDEVQKIPSILDEVHLLIEKYKKKISFVLLGSSARKLKRGGANLLAGRAWLTRLHPLSIIEIDVNLDKALHFSKTSTSAGAQILLF